MKLFTAYGIYLGVCAGGAGLNVALRRWKVRPSLAAAANVLLFLGVAAGMAWVSEPSFVFDDFRKAYYPAPTLAFHHPGELYSRDDLMFVNIPIVALLFAPFSALPYVHAALAFTLAGLAAVAAAWCLLVRLTGVTGWHRLALLGLFLASGPLYYSLREGNVTHFVLLLLVLAAWCLETRGDFALGVLLGTAGLIKPLLFLLPVYFVLKRRWRVAAGAAALVLLAGTASLLLFGVDLHRAWLDRCIGRYAARPMTAHNLQSAASVCARLFTDGDSGLSWRPVELTTAGKAAHRLLLVLLAGLPLLACLRRPGPDRQAAERLEFCMVLCLALLTSTVSWTHYYLLLLLPAALYLGGRLPIPATRPWAMAFGAAFLLTAPPVLPVSSPGWAARLLVSHCWAGGTLILGLLTAARWQAASHRPGAQLVLVGGTRFSQTAGEGLRLGA
jgi:hypothetical protein